jgi:putative endonuclease
MSKRRYIFYVYIMASPKGTLYTGVTNNLVRRVSEHKEDKVGSFSKRYGCTKLVYYEQHQYIYNAIEREKEIKNFIREKKEELIKEVNPKWEDLSNNLE